MPPIVIDVRRAEDGRDVVHRAVQTLVEGELVVFPTETVYGMAACALHDQAVEKLIRVKGRVSDSPVALAVKGADVAWDYVREFPPIARRLARRCWPGPVTLVLPADRNESLLQQLPERVQRIVCPGDTLGFRVPAHPVILDVLDLLPGPLLLTSANRSGHPDASSAEEVIQAIGDDVRLILDDGPCRFGNSSTVVLVTGQGYRILREGVVTPQAVKQLASLIVILVCTGNTCRSPMAEVLMRAALARRLGISPDRLEESGIVVMSAGSAAMHGAPASREAVEVMRHRGLDLSQHAAQPVTERLARDADIIYTMTRGHRETLLDRWPDIVDRVQLLSPEGHDVSDPIGGPYELYQKCADQISRAVDQRVAELDESLLHIERL